MDKFSCFFIIFIAYISPNNEISASFMITAKKIIHRGILRIKVDFPYNQAFAQILQQIEVAKWSKTHKAWHIPYTKTAFEHLKRLFPETIIETAETNKPITVLDQQQPNQQIAPATNPIATPKTDLPTISAVLIEVIGKKIIVKMPMVAIDVKFILTFRYSRWDKEQRFWVIPNYGDNLELLKSYFKDRLSNVIIHQEKILPTTVKTSEIVNPNEVLAIQIKADRYKLIFSYNKNIVSAIKTMPFWSWNHKNRWWTIPISDRILTQLQTVVQAEGWTLRL